MQRRSQHSIAFCVSTTRWRRAWFVMLALTLALSALTTTPTAAQMPKPGSGLDYLGTIALDRFDRPVVDNVHKHLLVLRPSPADGGSLLAYDGNRALVRTLPMAPNHLPFGSAGRPIAHALDEAAGRLFVLVFPSGTDRDLNTSPQLAVINTATLVVDRVTPLTGFQRGMTIKGMSYSAEVNRIYVEAEFADPNNSSGLYMVQLLEVDPATGRGTWAEPFTVPQCQKGVGYNLQAGVVRNPVNDRVYLGCGTGNFSTTPQPGVPAVASIDVRDPAAITAKLYPLAGSYSYGESLYDPVTHKFVMVASGPNIPAQAAWLFDEEHEVFTGVVSAGDLNVYAVGLNPLSGRFYVGIDGALLVGSDRGLKTPQALKFELSQINGPAVIAVPFDNTVIVQTFDGTTATFHVFKDTLPAYVPPIPEDPDAGTSQIEEAPGRTEVSFSGDALAFGSRARSVGGFNGVAQNLFPDKIDYWTFLGKPGNLNDGDRDAYFARVVKSHLSASESTGIAIAGDRDANTAADYTNSTQSEWPFEAAQCADLGGGEAEDTGDDATVSCNRAAAKTVATATHGDPAATPVLTMGGSTSSTKLERDPVKGMVSVAEAEVRDVVIGGVIRFGKITSTAKATAKGRTGTATAAYERRFEDVQTPVYSCSKDCDPERVAAAINEVIGTKVRAQLPRAEVVATPGGARGSVLRDAWEHQQDIVLNNQAATERQIAALRLIYVNDNASRSRVMYEFAATQADANYSVFALPTSDGGGDGGTLEEVFAGSNLGGPAAAQVDSPPAMTSHSGGNGGGNVVTRLLRRLGHGLRLALLGRSHTVLNILLWALLATPVFMALRRRYLVHLMGEAR